MAYNISKNYCNFFKRFENGTELWKYLKTQNIFNICSFLFGGKTAQINNSYQYHRLYDNKINISVKGVYPDISYYRLIPRNKINMENVVTHTYEVQYFLFSHQHPSSCINKRYLIIRGYGSGHGSEIHVITSYLALAVSLDRIAILDPYVKSSKAKGNYCKKYKNWLCFLEQLTNCSLETKAYLNAVEFLNDNQSDVYVYIGGTLKMKNVVPHQILDIIKYSHIPKNRLLHYWRIQASTFIFRLNIKTFNKVNKIINKSVGKKLHNGCFNIWVRHGDKYKEMKLLNPRDYLPSYELYSIIIGKNVPIYLSTDDPNVTNYFDNYKNTVTYYLNFSRRNDNLGGNMKRGSEMTLNFIADIKAALYCYSFSGTRSSNVVRLIDELRSTVGLSANMFYFENGKINIKNISYEYIEYW